MFLIKLATVMAFFIPLLVIHKQAKIIETCKADFQKLKQSHENALAELNVHEQNALVRMECENEC